MSKSVATIVESSLRKLAHPNNRVIKAGYDFDIWPNTTCLNSNKNFISKSHPNTDQLLYKFNPQPYMYHPTQIINTETLMK